MIKHLTDSLTDHMQFTTTAGAGLMLNVEPPALARQLCRQAWSINLRLGCGRLLRTWWELGLDPREIGLKIFESELQLIVVEPLGPPTKLVALELLHDQPQPLDL